ncbi:formyltetrahydrofolate-dependent phosphoribosylglycinamide formyltransferase [Hypnocyclicus thermotrophus]|uniref:Phosphoribosylglycinamide formyltransferase n=1 Tax=Hypnocyclicus thermotrophus TaxID=1627895 RepID=A0AA46E0C3_9FUSO|nr:phosphoribosylglycinamide formyltransferase [Hypnocyclicus thermotrophus]TDT71986.1 formyltetrahydrofolate-dependent phosphoribosylglycinamide formyltransferase [Hypnocyclicus thermotrophus]
MLKIVVLISGSGSNLQSIIDAIEEKKLNAKIECVISDREAYGIERAKKHNIKTYLFNRKELKKNLFNEIEKVISNDIDLIILAGFLSIVSSEFIKKWENKIINIHPSLLPKFGGKGMYGMNVHRAVVENKEIESGCTVHFVTNEIDGGEIIAQKKVPVYEKDTAEDVQKRVLEKEHELLVEAIKILEKDKKKR